MFLKLYSNHHLDYTSYDKCQLSWILFKGFPIKANARGFGVDENPFDWSRRKTRENTFAKIKSVKFRTSLIIERNDCSENAALTLLQDKEWPNTLASVVLKILCEKSQWINSGKAFIYYYNWRSLYSYHHIGNLRPAEEKRLASLHVF